MFTVVTSYNPVDRMVINMLISGHFLPHKFAGLTGSGHHCRSSPGIPCGVFTGKGTAGHHDPRVVAFSAITPDWDYSVKFCSNETYLKIV
jgi:hypothetical protein